MRAVDLLAGAGGLSEGAVQAGARVVFALNHNQLAIDSHKLNHPTTKHVCQDVGLFNALNLPAYDLLLAAPSCTGHSPARGKDQPHHDAARATAWCVVDIAEATQPRAILVENVPALLAWKLYPVWRDALARLGYRVTVNELDAADFGVAQNRVRVFIMAIRGKRCPPMVVRPVQHQSFESIMDASPKWVPVAGHVAKTLARVAAGRRDFGRRFVMPYYKSGSGETGRALHRPIGTLTTRARWAVVDGDRMRMVSIPECKRAMGFRPDYQILGTVAQQHMQIGNAVSPVVGAAAVRHLMEAA